MAVLLRYTVVAEPAAASVLRQHVRLWLAELAWPSDEADDVVLAVSEAVCNAIEHGYRQPGESGSVMLSGDTVQLRDGDRQVLVTVSDRGSWRPHPAESENRRRGIPLMRALTDSVHIVGMSTGTRVTLTSRPVPTPSWLASRHSPWSVRR